MHTEEEARKLICPHLQQSHTYTHHSPTGPQGIDRTMAMAVPVGPSVPSKCQASGCAMWRWDMDGGRMVSLDDGRMALVKHSEEMVGFCGLAGRRA